MNNGTALLVGAVILGGVAYYAVSSKKKTYEKTCGPGYHLMPDGTCMLDADMSAGSPVSVPEIPDWIPESLVTQYNLCWQNGVGPDTGCSPDDFQQVINDLTALALSHPGDAPTLNYFSQQLYWRQWGSGTRGVTGRHTGGCSCQARQEAVGTGACCDSCAKGEECEECGNNAPAVG